MTASNARVVLATLLVIALAVIAPLTVSAQEATLSSLLVKLAPGLSPDAQAAVIARNGGVETSAILALRLHVVAVLTADLARVMANYQADPQVQHVELNATRQSETIPADALYAYQWALPKIGWDQTYGSLTPTGTATVALLDTGIDASHPELAGATVPGTSILDGSNGMSDPSGHGTSLAGIIAARTDNGLEGIAGVAYAGVRLMPVTVLNASGEGQDGDVIAGVIWAADHGADVILMAFSAPEFSQNLQDAIDYAWSKGVVIVAAVGNNAVSTPTFPAGDRGVMGVAATDATDAQAYFSNQGQAVFIAAPGVDIQTIDLNGNYVVLSGTSASAAHVAGLAGFMKAVDPTLTNGVIVGRIARNADPAGTADQTGNGRINMPRALADVSMESVQPAGADPVGQGGPFVGPYRAAAKNLVITFAGSGAGSVALTDTTAPVNNTSCTGSCSPSLGNNDVGTLTATAAADSTFTGWSAQSAGITGCGASSCSFSMGNNAQSVTATFASRVTSFRVEAATGGAIGAQTAGTAFTIKVTALDSSNATVTGFSGKVTITSTGTLAAGAGPTANFVAGVLASHGVTISNTGTFTITATGLAPNTAATGVSASFVVGAGAPVAGNSTITGTGPVVADGLATSTVTVTLKDANSNPVPGVTPTFTATDTGSTNVYGACSAGNASGVSTCTLASTKAEVKTLSLATPVAKSGGAVTFTAGALDHFLVEAGAGGTIGTQTAGTSFSIRMTAQDAFNNTVTSFTTTAALSTTAGTISPSTSGAFGAGVRTESVSVTLAGSGKTITATASGNSGTSTGFTVNPGAPAAGSSTISGTGPVVADGVALSSVTITLKDANNNALPGVTPTFTATDTGSTNVYGGCSATDASGVSTCTLRSTRAEVKTLSIATPVVKSGGTVTFTAGALTRFLVEAGSGGPIATQTAGAAFAIRITAQDAFGNTVPGFAGTVTLSTTAGAIAPTTSGAFSGGVRTEGVSVTQAGTGKTITATATGGTETGTSNAFTVGVAALAKFAVDAAPAGGPIGTQTAGSTFNIRVTAQDAFGNTVTAFDGNGFKATITSTGTLSVGAGTTPAFTGGVLASYAVAVTNTGSFTITATGSGNDNDKSGTSNAFTVSPGALASFAVQQSGGGAIGAQTAGVAFSLRLTARDAFNNTKTDFAGTAVLTSNATLAGAPLTTPAFTAGVLDPQGVTISSTGAAVSITATSGAATGTSNAFAVNARTTSTSVSCDSPVVVGQGSTCTTTVTDTSAGTASTPTGTVSVTATGAGVSPSSTSCTLTGSAGSASCAVQLTGGAAGPINVAASYGADATHATSVGNASITVNRRDTSTTVSSTGTPSTFGQAVSFTATVVGTGAGAGNPNGGTVQFVVDGVNLGSRVSVVAGSATSASTSSLMAGLHSVTAAYSGDGSFNGSTSAAFGQTVNKAGQTISVTTSAPLTAVYNTTFGVAATATSGLGVAITTTGGCSGAGTGSATVTMTSGTTACVVHYNQGGDGNYDLAGEVTQTTSPVKATATVALASLSHTYDGAQKAATATTNPLGLTVDVTYNGSSTAPTGAGSYTVVATVNDANYQGSAADTLVIGQAAQTIMFAALADKHYGDPDFTVSATGGASGQPVTFTAAGSCTVTGDLVHIPGVGSCTVTAHQAGDTNYSAAADVPRAFQITDNVPPDTTMGTGPTSPTNATTAVLTFSGTDDVTVPASLGFECSLDGSPFAACTSPATYSVLGEGAHTFYVRAKDAAGNVDLTPAQFSWTIDLTPPDAIIDSMPFDPTNQTSATFAFHASEAGSTLWCSLDGAPAVSCVGPVTYPGLLDGLHSFAVYATDQAGNQGNAATFAWTVDTQAPDTAIDTAPNGITSSNTATFAFHASETSSFLCRLDGNPAVACASPVTYNGLAAGSHTFTVTSTDAAGNADQTPASFTWVIDTQAPDAQISGGPADGSATTSTSASFDFTGTDNVSQPQDLAFECDLDGAGFAACSSPAFYSGLSRTAHTFSVRAIDQAGNVDATPATATWTIVKINPVITWSDPADITYPTALGATQLAATADVPGTFGYTPAAGVVLGAGNGQSLSVLFTPTDTTNYNTATRTVSINVLKGTQATLTVIAPATLTFGTTATLTASGGSGGGAVTFSAGGSTGCSVAGDQLSVTNASATCSVSAAKAGDANYHPTTSASVAVTLVKADQAALTLTGVPATAAYLSSFTVTPGGGSGSAALVVGTAGVCGNAGNAVTMQSGTGTCTVKVNRAGDANYNAAVEVSASATATKIDQAALTLTGVPATATYLSSFTVTPGGGSSSAALVVGTAGVCGNAGNAVTMQSGTGTCTVKVNRAGDANYYPATEVGASATAAKAGTTTTVAGLTPAPAILGLSVNVSVSVQSVAAPGGTVTVTNGSSSCTAALAGGTGSCSLTASAIGQNAFVVTYPGDGTNFNGSTGQGGDVQYNFTGFFQPIDNLPVVNAVKAGQAVPIKFSLHGNQGLNIFMPNSPASVATSCGTFDPLDTVEETVTAGASSLSYDPGSDQYIYVWKTDKGWAAGSCRELQVTLKDGSVKKAHFKLTK